MRRYCFYYIAILTTISETECNGAAGYTTETKPEVAPNIDDPNFALENSTV